MTPKRKSPGSWQPSRGTPFCYPKLEISSSRKDLPLQWNIIDERSRPIPKITTHAFNSALRLSARCSSSLRCRCSPKRLPANRTTTRRTRALPPHCLSSSSIRKLPVSLSGSYAPGLKCRPATSFWLFPWTISVIVNLPIRAIWIIRARPEVPASYFFLAISLDHLGDCELANKSYQDFVRRADAVANKNEVEEARTRSVALQRLIKERKCGSKSKSK